MLVQLYGIWGSSNESRKTPRVGVFDSNSWGRCPTSNIEGWNHLRARPGLPFPAFLKTKQAYGRRNRHECNSPRSCGERCPAERCRFCGTVTNPQPDPSNDLGGFYVENAGF